MRIDNQQQQNKGVMDLMPQTGAVEEKNGIQMFADAVKTESSKKSAGTTSFQAKEVTYLNPAKEEKKTVIDENRAVRFHGCRRAKSTDGCACGNYFTGRL